MFIKYYNVYFSLATRELEEQLQKAEAVKEEQLREAAEGKLHQAVADAEELLHQAVADAEEQLREAVAVKEDENRRLRMALMAAEAKEADVQVHEVIPTNNLQSWARNKVSASRYCQVFF